MRIVRVLCLLAASIVAIARVACSATVESQLPRYTVQVIEGVPDAIATAVNNKGEVLVWAYAAPDGKSHSYVWANGKVTDIGSLSESADEMEGGAIKGLIPGVTGYAMNDRDQVVGVAQSSAGSSRAFLWQDGKMRDLGTLGGKASCAQGINNQGQVVGYYENSRGERRAFIWEDKRGMRDLGVPTRENSALAINDKGQVIGTSFTTGATFLWEKNHAKTLESRPMVSFGPFQALNISKNGDMIGTVKRGGVGDLEARVFVYSKGKFTQVKNSARYNSSAFGLTPEGLVVGNAFDTPDGQRAFVWKGGHGAILNDLLEPKSAWNIRSAIAVNEKGQIAASGILDGKKQIVLLTPVKKGR